MPVLRNNRLSEETTPPFALFAIEGAMLQTYTSINSFANNMFATELGATDRQIALVQTIPNLAAVLLLLPIGLLAERLRSSRTLLLSSLLCIITGFSVMAVVPGFGQLRLPVFFLALVLTVGGPVFYNAHWQSFLGDVGRPGDRNGILTIRNLMMSAVGIAAPVLCALAMAGVAAPIAVYRAMFLICAAAALVQVVVICMIRTPVRERSGAAERRGKTDWKKNMKELFCNRQFLWFFFPVVFFYISWQLDWSMWYICEVQYLKMTEAEISLYSGIFNIGQLAAVAVLSRNVRKHGPDRTLPLAGLGLFFCPAIMIFCYTLPQRLHMVSLTALVTLFNAPMCAVNLCIVQILLRVVSREHRNLAVSLYTMTITFTACFAPLLGVQLYTALGANARAMVLFNLTAMLVRFAAFLLLRLRCRFVEAP